MSAAGYPTAEQLDTLRRVPADDDIDAMRQRTKLRLEEAIRALGPRYLMATPVRRQAVRPGVLPQSALRFN